MAKRMWVAVESSQLPGGPVMTTMAKGIDPADPPAWMVEAGAKALHKGDWDVQDEAMRRSRRNEAEDVLVAALSASDVRDSTDAR